MTESPDAQFRVRAIGGHGRGKPDHVVECLQCAALVTYDGAAMQRHSRWHAARDAAEDEQPG